MKTADLQSNINIATSQNETVTMKINGTTYIIRENFGDKETVNDIIAKRIINLQNTAYSSENKTLL